MSRRRWCRSAKLYGFCHERNLGPFNGRAVSGARCSGFRNKITAEFRLFRITDEVDRFRRGKEYCSYFGMTPKLDESGSTRRLGHISKQGPSVVRWLIVESAWRAIKKSPPLLAFYERVRHGQNKRKKIAIVATARKMLSIMRAMQTTGEVFNENLVLEQEQYTVTKELSA